MVCQKESYIDFKSVFKINNHVFLFKINSLIKVSDLIKILKLYYDLQFIKQFLIWM